MQRFLVAGLCVSAMLVAGCGGDAEPTSAPADRVAVTEPAPTYRAGQYCVSSKATQYARFGFACRKGHLIRA